MASSKSPPDPPNVRAGVRAGLRKVKEDSGFDEQDVKELVALEIARVELELSNESALIKLRKRYGKNLIRFLWWYFIITVLLIVADALPLPFELPEPVEVALVGGTAVGVLGVVGTIAAGLFREPKQRGGN